LIFYLTVVATILVWASSSSSSIADAYVPPPFHRLLVAWTTPSQAAIDTNRAFTKFLDLDYMAKVLYIRCMASFFSWRLEDSLLLSVSYLQTRASKYWFSGPRFELPLMARVLEEHIDPDVLLLIPDFCPRGQ